MLRHAWNFREPRIPSQAELEQLRGLIGWPLVERERQRLRLPLAGMDCVEVSPPYDHAELSSYAAACFVWTYLCGRIARGA